MREMTASVEQLKDIPSLQPSKNRHMPAQFWTVVQVSQSWVGVAEVNAGLAGKELPLQAHLVEGPTPLLLSSKWLHDHAAIIDFRSGQARFDFAEGKTIQLQRTRAHHLLLPIDAFMGNAEVLKQMQMESEHPEADKLSSFGDQGNPSTGTDQP